MNWFKEIDVLRLFATAACAIGMAASAAQAADVQKCKMNTAQTLQGDMIAQEIYLIRNGADLLVMDNVIAFFNKDQPMAARITSDKANSLSFTWDVLMVNTAGQRTKMQYRGTLFKATSELHVMARPVGFPNNFSATGICAPYQG